MLIILALGESLGRSMGGDWVWSSDLAWALLSWALRSARQRRAVYPAGILAGRMGGSAGKPDLRAVGTEGARALGGGRARVFLRLGPFGFILRSVDHRPLLVGGWSGNSFRFYSNWASGP